MDEDDKIILELEHLYAQRSKPLENDRGPATFSISQALWSKLGEVYGKTRSDKIEEDMIKRLRLEGRLPPPMSSNRSGGGAQEHFNPTNHLTLAPDYVLDNPFEKVKPKTITSPKVTKKPKK